MKKTININSLLFIAIISIYFATFLNLKFWSFSIINAEINNIFAVLALFFAIFTVFFLFFILFSFVTCPYIGKIITGTLLIFSAASDYCLQYLGIVINHDMIRNLVETDYGEALDFITANFICYVTILGIIPAIGLFFINIVYDNFKKELKKRALCILSGILIIISIFPFFSKYYLFFGRNHYQIRYYLNTANYIYGVIRYYKENASINRKFVILDSAPTIIPNESEKPVVTVLIIGETARAANFSLYGYKKKTNPLLEKQDIYVFKDTTSYGTSTAVSLPYMFYPSEKKEFSVIDAKYKQNILDIIKATDTDIIWKDNDGGCKGVCLRVPYTDARIEKTSPYCFDDYCYDEILLNGLDDYLNHIQKNTLIVLHTMGSHGPSYHNRYPTEMEKFKPVCNTNDLQKCTSEEIINAYDNTMLYTDYFISSVIDILKTKNNIQTSMLYVSDHGESLGEHNIYLHGMPAKIAPKEQKKIPMILWLSDSLKKNMDIDADCLHKKAAKGTFSHDNYPHTVLGLMRIKTTVYKEKFNLLYKCSKNVN